MKPIKIVFLITIMACLTLVSCAKDVAIGNYDASEVGKIKKVIPGVIISKRPVIVHDKTGTSSAASTSTENTANTLVEGNDYRSRGVEYVIKLNNGSIISVVQMDKDQLKVNQRILVIYGDNTRVVADEGKDDI